MSALADKHAAVIGIDAYSSGLAALRTAAGDARAVAAALRDAHGYQDPLELIDETATADGILRLLEHTLPEMVGSDSALVLYFAGHGIALDGDNGPQGYLIPQDGHSGQPETWVPMDRFRRALAELPCRHLLVILDCCFAGSFRWASTRKTLLPPLEPLYDSQYARFLEGTAWQVLTSASHEEEAQDVMPGRYNLRDHGKADEHSPFATALLAGLAGDSDSSRVGHGADGVITTTELYQYVFEELVPAGSRRRQTPGLWPLKPDNTGEFMFLSPRRKRKTRPDPPLDDAHNPWLGLKTYDADDRPLFFGRDRVVEALEREVRDGDSPLIRVVGASGTGKSSVVKAGLLPRLRQPPPGEGEKIDEWRVVVCERLGGLPRKQLAGAVERLGKPDQRRLVVIDQFEELFTQCRDSAEAARFLEELAELLTAAGRDLRVLITLRSDFEPQLTKTALDPWIEKPCGRYQVPRFSSEELRETIDGPARVRAMFFDPPELVDKLIDEVVAMPAALPLLSFALHEMYRRSVLRRRRTGALDRSLNETDYRATGGVVGSLHRCADELLQDAEANGRLGAVRRVALRMVSTEGGRVARRRISEDELKYADAAEQERVDRVIERLTEARLLVRDKGYIEPAHDTLVQAWPQLNAWMREADAKLSLMRAVWRAATAWKEGGRDSGLLWISDKQLRELKDSRAELNELELEFADLSARRRFLGRVQIVAAIGALSVVALLAGLAMDRQEIAPQGPVVRDPVEDKPERKETEVIAARLEGLMSKLSALKTHSSETEPTPRPETIPAPPPPTPEPLPGPQVIITLPEPTLPEPDPVLAPPPPSDSPPPTAARLPPELGVTLYVDRNFQGRGERFADDDPDLSDNFVGDDTVTSVWVDPGCQVVLFEEVEYRGRSLTLTGDTPILRGTQIGNDQISSLRVSCPRQTATEQFAAAAEVAAILYLHEDYRGPSEEVRGHIRNLGSLHIGQDSVTSVRVTPGCEIVLYQRTDYRGASTTLDADTHTLRRTKVGNDSASSVKVFCQRQQP